MRASILGFSSAINPIAVLRFLRVCTIQAFSPVWHGGELCFHFILHNSSFSLSVQRPSVGSSDWLGTNYLPPKRPTKCLPSAYLMSEIFQPVFVRTREKVISVL